MNAMFSHRLLLLLLVPLFGAGCFAMRPPEKTPDETFGHRAEEAEGEGGTTVAISAPRESVQYRYQPAVFESVFIRPAPITSGNEAEGVQVEVLVKGAFPDSCSELHDMDQERTGNLLEVTLTMRRPQGAICASVLRPYRFYFMLEGLYVPGSYTMRLNDRAEPFQVRSASDD